MPHTAPNGEILWVHPDLIEDDQWTTSSTRKGKGKSCNATSTIFEEDGNEAPTFPLSEEEQEVFATRSRNEYHFNYPSPSDQLAEQGLTKRGTAKTLTELG